MTTTHHTHWRNRLIQVEEETAQLFQKELEAGTVPTALAEKLNHLFNTASRYRQAVNESLADNASDTAPAPMGDQFLIPMPPVATSLPLEPIGVVESAQLHFLELGDGEIINMHQVVRLSVKLKTLFLTGGSTVSLEEKDLHKLKYWLRQFKLL